MRRTWLREGVDLEVPELGHGQGEDRGFHILDALAEAVDEDLSLGGGQEDLTDLASLGQRRSLCLLFGHQGKDVRHMSARLERRNHHERIHASSVTRLATINSMPIVPDTKNWTWVLERPCDECGFDATTMPAGEVAGAIRAMLPTWQAVLARPDVRSRPSDDRWSPLEYACHVRDVFVLFLERLTLMLTQDDAHFANWDQDETAEAERYNEQDPDVVADQLVSAGTALADAFDAVAGDQWKRMGYRSDGASFPVDDFAVYLIHDPLHHLWDIGAA